MKCGKYPQAREGDPREPVTRFASMSSLTFASISQSMIAQEIGVPVLWYTRARQKIPTITMLRKVGMTTKAKKYGVFTV